MGKTYTVVETPDGCCVYRGELTREQAVSEVRSSYERRLEEAKEFLAKPAAELRVYVQDGKHTGRVIRELTAMTDNMQRARELLKKSCDEPNWELNGEEGELLSLAMDEDAALRAIAAALRLAVPEGMVLVPREPTDEMIHNMAASLDYPSVFMGGPSERSKRAAARTYRAMLAAAPTVSAEGVDKPKEGQ